MFKKLLSILLVLFLVQGGAAFAQSGPQTITLKPGFNFISFTNTPPALASELKAQYSFIDDIYYYSPAAGSFLTISEDTLTKLALGKGYIIRSQAGGAVTISGSASGALGNINLKAGFNLAGFSKAPGAVKFTTLITGSSVIESMYKWNASSGSFIQVTRTGGASDGIDPTVTAGQSYFIKVSEDTTFSVDGSAVTVGGAGFPVKLINNSAAYKAAETYIAIIGQDTSHNHYYYDLKLQDMRICTDDVTGASYCFLLSDLESAGANAYKYLHPFKNTASCRVYIFFKNKGHFAVHKSTDPKSAYYNQYDPLGGFMEPAQSNASLDKFTVFDKFELTCDGKSVWLNTTMVDFISIPFNLKFDCDNSVRGFDGVTTQQLFDMFTSRTDKWKNAVVYDGNNNIMRVLAPNQDENKNDEFGSLQSAIDNGWEYYRNRELTFSFGGYNYKGVLQTQETSVDKGSFIFTVLAGSKSDVGETCKIPKPSSFVVYKCADAPLANDGSDAHKNLTACIGSALNRGVFCSSDWGKITDFYVTTTQNAGQYNVYSKLLHEKALNGLVYGFPYDDHFGKDSTQNKSYADAQKGVTVTIPAMPSLK